MPDDDREKKVDCCVLTRSSDNHVHGDYYSRPNRSLFIVLGPKRGLSWLVNLFSTIVNNEVTMMGLIVGFPAVSIRSTANQSSSCIEERLASDVLGCCIGFLAMVNCHHEWSFFVVILWFFRPQDDETR
jgi:hypothetical protein